MSPELANLVEAIQLLAKLRVDAAGIDFAWKRINSAEKYLQKQVAPHFAESPVLTLAQASQLASMRDMEPSIEISDADLIGSFTSEERAEFDARA
jgi:hypothetical protein